MIFNLHTVHTPDGLEHSAAAFRRLIDHAIARGGSYFLTYHRWATAGPGRGVLSAVPRVPRAASARYDPDERFQSDWYRHYRDALA